MGQSDALSRRPDHCPDEDHDNEDIVMLDNELFVGLLDMDLQERIANGKIMDFDASEAIGGLITPPPIPHGLCTDSVWTAQTSSDSTQTVLGIFLAELPL